MVTRSLMDETYQTTKILNSRAHVIPIFDDRFKYVPPKPSPQETNQIFDIGSNYILKGVECDDFSMPSKEFQLLGIIDTLEGIKLDSLIMKQISGPTSTIFSLTKSDCKKIGIDFQQGLQLFPKNLNWEKKVDETSEVEVITPAELEFSPTDMSTYPRCHIDETIRKFLIKITGFRLIGDEVYDCEGHRVALETLRVKTKHIFGGNGLTSAMIPIDLSLNYQVATSAISQVSTSPWIDILGNIYLEVDLTQNQHSFVPSWVKKTEDGHLGVAPAFLRGEFHEHFSISYSAYAHVPTYTNFDMFKNQPRLTPSEVDDILLNHRFLVEDSHTQLQNALQRLNITQDNLGNTKKRLNETKMRLAERKRRLRIPSSDIDDFYI